MYIYFRVVQNRSKHPAVVSASKVFCLGPSKFTSCTSFWANFESFAVRCTSCGEPTMSSWITWHRNHRRSRHLMTKWHEITRAKWTSLDLSGSRVKGRAVKTDRPCNFRLKSPGRNSVVVVGLLDPCSNRLINLEAVSHKNWRTSVEIESQTKAELKIERLVRYCLKLNLPRLSAIETVFLQDPAGRMKLQENRGAISHASHVDSKSE